MYIIIYKYMYILQCLNTITGIKNTNLYIFLEVTKAYYQYCLNVLLSAIGMHHDLKRILQKCKLMIFKVLYM